jgi:hypothetical protein
MNMNTRVSSFNRTAWATLRSAIITGGLFLVMLLSTGQVTAGTAELAWVPPTKNEDGSPFELRRYKVYIYRGERKPDCKTITDMQNLKVVMETAKPIQARTDKRVKYTVEDLPPGTYFLAVTAVGENRRESACSNIVEMRVR